jgi:pimeloyl-ACP methyl ester carboxylesterase
MKKFEKPSLFLLGRQDSAVGYKDAWSIIEKYPRSTFAIVDKAGHSLQIENEKLFNSLVCEWLTRVEEFG